MATSQEYGLGVFNYPRGWFMVADAAELGDNPMSLRYFGQDMVLYRGESGRVFLVDAYCPHMGAHLGRNQTSYVVLDGKQIQGDSIRCPYHGWRFGPDGQCDDIPYSDQPIPKSACINTWPVQERAGVIWVWYDPEGGKPDYLLPEFPEWEDPKWVRWKIDHLGVLDLHPIEIVDNMADRGHMTPIHGSIGCHYFENEFNGHICTQRFSAGHRTLAGEDHALELNTYYTGPAILQSEMQGDFATRMIICHTPIDDGTIQVWHALMVQAVKGEEQTEQDVATARAYQETSCAALSQDLEVWQNKRPCFQPMQIRADGPFRKVRTWYQQFYNPRSEAQGFQKRVNGVHVTRGTERDPWETRS